MVLLVKGTVTVKLLQPSAYAEELKCVRGVDLLGNYTGTIGHVSHLKSFFSSWVSWVKQNICESVLAQTLPYKTRYWLCSGRTWKIWEAGVGTYKHLKSKYNPSGLKLLNIFQYCM